MSMQGRNRVTRSAVARAVGVPAVSLGRARTRATGGCLAPSGDIPVIRLVNGGA